MIDYSLILVKNYINAKWSINGDSYDGLIWLDESPKPSKEELDGLWASTQATVAKDQCKAKAKELLAASDWSVLSDVGLQNAADFVAYRTTLRNYVINPVEQPVFPTEPNPVWS